MAFGLHWDLWRFIYHKSHAISKLREPLSHGNEWVWDKELKTATSKAAALDNSWIVWRTLTYSVWKAWKYGVIAKLKLIINHSQLHDKVEVWFTLEDVLQGNYVGMFNPRRERKKLHVNPGIRQISRLTALLVLQK